MQRRHQRSGQRFAGAVEPEQCADLLSLRRDIIEPVEQRVDLVAALESRTSYASLTLRMLAGTPFGKDSSHLLR